MSGKSIMLAAGGTGGHLFPAFALSEELTRRGYVVDLMTDMRGDRYGSDFPARQIYNIPSATLGGKSPIAIVKTLYKLVQGTISAWLKLGKVKPAAVVGFGGYPTFPPLVAAKLRGIPSAVHEQNAVMGRANRMMAPLVETIAASFDKTKYVSEKYQSKVKVTGNPVRQVVLDASQNGFDHPMLGGPFHLLVFGGSQGARFFSDTVPEAIAALPQNLRNRLRVVQQCREEDLDRVRKIYDELGVQAELAPFFKELPAIMADAHLVIGRSGASSVAELAVLGRPSILVPLPHALDNDQLQNAIRLMDAGGAWCIAQKDLNAERLAQELEAFLMEPQRLVQAAQAAKAVGKPHAVSLLADMVEDLVNGSKGTE